jgi:N-methylhydantoinase A
VEAEQYLERVFPDLPISLSHRIAPIWREYERSSTTIADSYVKPLMRGYCKEIKGALSTPGVAGPCSLLKSDGGTTTLELAPLRPVQVLLSGLAGGIVGGKYFAQSAGYEDAITLDMGGTSCDVGLVVGGNQQFTTEFELEWGLPVAVPVTEVRTLGAGGGSIAWIDRGGMLNVGPRSAGAKPGPACYGMGGAQPTITDANLVMGRLNPDFFLGGELPLHVDRARDAIGPLAQEMGLSLEAASMAIVDIADENMTNAIRLLTIERGIDPRDFVLVAFGGAGPLHAVSIAGKLGIQTVVIPPHPGLCSAFGAAISELRVEKVHTMAARGSEVDDAELHRRFDAMLDESRSEIREEGLREAPRETMVLSMRYGQQNYEQDIAYSREDGLIGACQSFHRRHHEFYGYHFDDEPIELVNLKVSVSEVPRAHRFRLAASGERSRKPARRTVIESAGRSVESPAYRRHDLDTGTRYDGPAVIEELDSTTFVPSVIAFQVDEQINMILQPV